MIIDMRGVARFRGFELSMIMTFIQRPATPTRYHTHTIINTTECMMFLRGLIHALPPDFFSPLLHYINDYRRDKGEKIIEHTIIESAWQSMIIKRSHDDPIVNINRELSSTRRKSFV